LKYEKCSLIARIFLRTAAIGVDLNQLHQPRHVLFPLVEGATVRQDPDERRLCVLVRKVNPRRSDQVRQETVHVEEGSGRRKRTVQMVVHDKVCVFPGPSATRVRLRLHCVHQIVGLLLLRVDLERYLIEEDLEVDSERFAWLSDQL